MLWCFKYLIEDLRRSFGLWEKHEAMSILLGLFFSAVLAALSAFGIYRLSEGFTLVSYIGFGLLAWFLWLLLVVTPMRMWKENTDTISRLTTRRLVVEDAEIYDDGMGCHWLRLRVENPTALPIKDCYGKLIDRRLITFPTTVQGQTFRQLVDPQVGGRSRDKGLLPPEGTRFPWTPTQLPETITTISGFGSKEFLYIVAKRKDLVQFGFPTDMGIKYDNWSLGEFQLVVEIGSEVEAFQPTKARVVFRAGGDIQFVMMDNI